MSPYARGPTTVRGPSSVLSAGKALHWKAIYRHSSGQRMPWRGPTSANSAANASMRLLTWLGASGACICEMITLSLVCSVEGYSFKKAISALTCSYTYTTCAARLVQHGSMKKHEMVVHGRRYPHRCPHCRKRLNGVNILRDRVHAQHESKSEGAGG